MDNKLFKVNKKSLIELISWLVGGLVLLIMAEYIQRDSLQNIITFFKDRTNAFFINYLLILIITSVIFITKRKKATYLIISLIILLLSIINKIILGIRGMPVTYADIYSIKDGIGIANKYITIPMIIGVVGLILVTTILIVYLFKKDKNSQRITSYINIIIAVLVIIVFSVKLSDLKERKVIDVLRWDLAQSYKHNGFAYSILDSYFGYRRKKPEEYNKANIENLKREINAIPTMGENKKETKKPNIIFVQLESFMDPTLIKEAKFSEDPIPNFRKLQQAGPSGMINVPVTGGGTARTEFEVLTGNSFDYLINGEVPYDSFVKEKPVNSIASTLKKQGYEATIMHNFQGNFYNRNNAFKNLGFDTFIPVEYMQNLEYTHLNWPKDIVLLDYIEKSLNQNNKPDLVYAISVEGHGSYPTDDRGVDLPIKVETTLSEEDKYQLYYYSNLMKGTDNLVGEIVKMVDNRDEDTIVVFYSDHMPALNVFKKNDFYLDKYETPYAIYSNFDIPKEKTNLEAYQLSTLAMGLANVDYGPIEKIHARRGNEKDYQKNLELVQYDMLFGKKYYLEDKDEPKASNMKLGLDDIVIDDVVVGDKVTTIKGKNFTDSSYVYVNDKKVETRRIDYNTLEIDNVDGIKKVCVKQLGRYDGELGSTKEYIIK